MSGILISQLSATAISLPTGPLWGLCDHFLFPSLLTLLARAILREDWSIPRLRVAHFLRSTISFSRSESRQSYFHGFLPRTPLFASFLYWNDPPRPSPFEAFNLTRAVGQFVLLEGVVAT